MTCTGCAKSASPNSIVEFARRGLPVVGICGGYQMLGQTLRDPRRIESSWAETRWSGATADRNRLRASQETNQVRAIVRDDRHCPGSRGRDVLGYEIHLGQTTGARPWLRISQRGGVDVEAADGAISDDGRIWGCYLHGLFANDFFRRAWLDSLAGRKGDTDCVSERASDFERSHEHRGQARAIAESPGRLRRKRPST